LASIFPANPSINDEFTSGDSTWIWDGTAWKFFAEPGSGGGEASDSFSQIITSPATQTVVADAIDDILTLASGSNVLISGNADTDTITIDADLSGLNFFKTIESYPETELIIAEGNDNSFKFVGGNNVDVFLSSASNSVLIDVVGDLENITSISDPNYIQFNTDYVPENGLPKSTIYWNEEDQSIDATLNNGVVLSLGQDEHYPPVLNNSGVQINRGELVMVTGVQGDKLTIAKAVTDGTIDFEYIIGVAAHNIPNTSDTATIVKFGYVKPFNTNSYEVGTLLYPDKTVPGGFTNVLPDAPAYKIPIAIVTKQGTGGTILVRMVAPSRLGESDSNVQFDNLADGDFLVYNSASGLWLNEQIPTTSVQYSTEPPVVEDIGSLWFDSEENGLYVYDGTFWINAVGPQGPMGPQGPEGPQGPQGIEGPAPDTSEFLTISSASSTYATIEDLENIDLTPYLTNESASSTYAPLDSPTFIGTVDFNSASVVGIDALPSQTGNDGKYLKTDGSIASWETLDIDAKADKNLTINQQAGSYSLQLSDNGKLIEMSGGGNLTVLGDGSANLPIGSQITILQTGASQVTIVGSGATINATPGLKLRAQWSSATLIKRAANTWVAIGDLVA